MFKNLFGENTFVCPAYWLAEAFTDKSRAAYRYQLSVPAAFHTADLYGYFGPPLSTFGPDFEKAFMSTVLLFPFLRIVLLPPPCYVQNMGFADIRPTVAYDNSALG